MRWLRSRSNRTICRSRRLGCGASARDGRGPAPADVAPRRGNVARLPRFPLSSAQCPPGPSDEAAHVPARHREPDTGPPPRGRRHRDLVGAPGRASQHGAGTALPRALPDQQQWVGQPAAGLVDRAQEHDEEVFIGPTPEGSDAYTAFSRAPQSRFTVSLTAPRAQLEGPLRRSFWLLSAAAVGAFALSLVVANLAGRRFTGRLRRLAGAFTAFGRGEAIPELPKFTLSELSGVSGALRDAMALLQARTAALRESEQRYRTTFERNPAGMCLATEAGRIVDCNEAFARILGFERPADVLVTNIAELYVQPKDREQLLHRVKATGTAVNVEIQMRRRDGQLIWVFASVVRSSGPPRGDFETTLIDITEQKAADELRTIARLAHGAAHEINNPLALVIGRLG